MPHGEPNNFLVMVAFGLEVQEASKATVFPELLSNLSSVIEARPFAGLNENCNK